MLYYIYLAAAVIAAIGIGVTGIMLIRRRRWAAHDTWMTNPKIAPAGGDFFSPTGGTESRAPAAATPQRPATPGSALQPAPDAEPEPEPEIPSEMVAGTPAAPSAEQVPAAAVAESGLQGTALEDPLGAVILDLADGEGKLTGIELKRLDVFRPERIEATVQCLPLPTHLQNDENVVFRLAQIQLYAASLILRAKWSAAARRGPEAADVPLTAREFKLKIARDVLELPPCDRNEVIGYVLDGLLKSPGTETPLKRAIIDTLEHLRSAALAKVLLDCLDDPDPIVQEYALAAAERVLDG